MDRARLEACGEALALLAPEDDLAHGLVVRQHADDDLAAEQVGKIGGGFEPERHQRSHLLRAPHAGDHGMAGGDEIRGHGRAHAAKADKPNVALRAAAAVGSGVALLWCSVRRRCGSEAGRTGLGLQHETAHKLHACAPAHAANVSERVRAVLPAIAGFYERLPSYQRGLIGSQARHRRTVAAGLK